MILIGHLQSVGNTTLNAVLPRDAERSMLSTAAGYSRRNIMIKTRKSIWRSWTWRRRLTGSPMKWFGVPFDHTRSLRHTSDGPNYQNTTSVVCCPAGTSPSFHQVHQGSALLPLLFILCMDTAMADIQSPHLLTNEEHQTLNAQMQQWKDRLNENGLQLDLTKAEYMECGPQTIGTTIKDGQDLKKVDCFKYLGSTLSADGDRFPDSRQLRWLEWRQVTRVLCDRRLPIHLKAKIYKTTVWPFALYGYFCKSWCYFTPKNTFTTKYIHYQLHWNYSESEFVHENIWMIVVQYFILTSRRLFCF